MNNVTEPYFVHFVRVIIYDFGIYVDCISYLKNLNKIFERVDVSYLAKKDKI